MSAPTEADYLAFIRNIMGIGTPDLPDNSPYVSVSYAIALEVVSLDLAQIAPTIYPLAVYNFAGDRLINFAPDQTGRTFFSKARADYQINSFVAGVIESSHDESTGQNMVVPEAFREFTMLDLQNLKTPYGRTYLMYAQQTGTLWGVT